jgi:hypothetical protein
VNQECIQRRVRHGFCNAEEEKSVLAIAFCLVASIAWADSLELKNGSLIKGKFLGGTESEIDFQVGSSVQKCVADIASLRFASDAPATDVPTKPRAADHVESKPEFVIVPAGTRISVRTSTTLILPRTTWEIISKLRLRNPGG